MGLDIRAYSKMKKAAPEVAAEIESSEYPRSEAYDRGLLIPWINPDFPGREEGIEEVPYEYEASWHFRAGSYSGHYDFRMTLCKMLGLGDFETWVRSLKEDTHGPLEELINFSDCEGTIGPVVAAKLAKEFEELEGRALEFALEQSVQGYLRKGFSENEAQKRALEAFESSGDGDAWDDGRWFLHTYRNWKQAFEMARDEGCVVFS